MRRRRQGLRGIPCGRHPRVLHRRDGCGSLIRRPEMAMIRRGLPTAGWGSAVTSETRARRIGKRIAEVLSELLQQAVDDPRLRMVTVSGVDVDRELAYATIYVTAFDAPERIDEILRTLVRARGFLRREHAAPPPPRACAR